MLPDLPLDDLGIVNVALQHGNFDLQDPHVLTPGVPERSMMLHRMQILGLGRMPHIASTMVDQDGVALIREWIEQLPEN